MAIEDLSSWANNIEIIRLPRIETDVQQNINLVGNLSTELSARVQQFVDTLLEHNARILAGQDTADSAQFAASQALTQLLGSVFQAQVYTDNRIQELRDQVTTNLNSIQSQLAAGSPFVDYIDNRIENGTGTVSSNLNAIVLGLQSELATIEQRLRDAEALSDDILNSVLPGVNQDLDASQDIRDSIVNQINRLMAGFDYETLIDGMSDIRNQVWQALDPIGKHVIVEPASDWTLEAHTNVYANPKPAMPASNLASSSHPFGVHGLFENGVANQTMGQAVPVDFIPGRFYLVRATVWVESGSVRVAIGSSTFAETAPADTGVKKVAADALIPSDGIQQFTCIFSTDVALLEELKYRVGSNAEDEAMALSGSGSANKAFFFVEQNGGGVTTGRLRMSKLEVIDITSAIDVVRISRERMQSQFRDAASSIETLQTSVVTLNTALAGLGTSLNSRIGDVETNISTNYFTKAETEAAGLASGAHAAAALSDRLLAETARSVSQLARDEAVGARDVAAGAASTSLSSLSLLSKVQSGSLLSNGDFETGDFFLWTGNAIGTSGTVLAKGASGSTAFASVPSNFFAALSYDDLDRSITGQKVSAEAQEVFAWSLRAARSVGGSTALRVSATWLNAAGSVISVTETPVTLSSTTWEVKSGTFSAPALTKAMLFSITRVGGSNPGTSRACISDVRLTRADPATMAQATQTFRTVAQVDSAISSAISTLQASVAGGLTATVNSQQTTIANVSGYAAATAMLTAVLSDGKIAGIRATVHNGDGSALHGSVLELIGDNVIATGTISANKLSVVSLDAISANLGTIQVDTLNIAGNAVTIPVYAYSAGYAGGIETTGGGEAISATINRAAGLSSFITFGCQIDGSAYSECSFSLRRNGTEIEMIHSATGQNGAAQSVMFQFIDTNTAGGVTTYSVVAKQLPAGALPRVFKRSLSIHQFKR